MLLLSQFPVGLSHGQRYKMLSEDSKKEKEKALIYPYNKNKFKTLMHCFGNGLKLSSVRQ